MAKTTSELNQVALNTKLAADPTSAPIVTPHLSALQYPNHLSYKRFLALESNGPACL